MVKHSARGRLMHQVNKDGCVMHVQSVLRHMVVLRLWGVRVTSGFHQPENHKPAPAKLQQEPLVVHLSLQHRTVGEKQIKSPNTSARRQPKKKEKKNRQQINKRINKPQSDKSNAANPTGGTRNQSQEETKASQAGKPEPAEERHDCHSRLLATSGL